MDKATPLLAIVLLPALGALINGLRAFLKPHEPKNRAVTNAVALGTTGLSALIAAWIVITSAGHPWQHTYFEWIPAGMGHAGDLIANFSIDFALRIDALSSTMLLIVTWIGFLIHVYATGYMSHEKGYTRFFTYLNLFMFMMLLLVLGANYMVMFVGWEGVGLCSYLLIGFYYDKHFAADAGKKAFITNRIGDFGFILGIFLIFNTFGTSDYEKVFALAAQGGEAAYGWIATAICLLLFVGACGKSAQVPLYVWLPDAMAGPTPVSALIHAATMVTAGVYMVVRSNEKFLVLDLLEGLKTTLRELFKPKVTIRYPEERMEPADRFRGMFKFSYDRCIACKLCAVACPIDIIYIDVHDDMIEEGGKKKKVKVLDRYDIDVKRCMFCALCEEACPTKPKSIWLTTKTYELASYDRNDLYFNMQELEYWDDRPKYTGLPDEEHPALDDAKLIAGGTNER